MDVMAALEGIISSVPQAVDLYSKIAPLITVRAGVTPEQTAVIDALVPVVHDAVSTAHDAIAALIASHGK